MFLCKKNTTPYPRDGVWAWFVCFCSTVVIAFVFGTLNAFGVLLPIWSEEFNFSRGGTAWIGSIAAGSIFLFSPVAIQTVSRFGERTIAFWSCWIIGAVIIVSSFVKELMILYFTYGLLYGIGASFVVNSSIFMLKRCFKNKFGLALGWLSSGGSIGTLALVPTLQALIDSLGWRNALRTMAGTWFLVAILTLSYNPNVEREEEEDDDRQSGVRNICSNFIDCSLWRSAKYTVGTIVISMTFFGYYVAMIHMVSFAKDRGISASKASLLFIFIGVLSGVSRVIIGKVMDKKWLTSFRSLQLSSFIVGTSILFLTLVKEYYHFILFAIYHGLGSGMFVFSQGFFYMTCFGNPRKDALAYGMGQIIKSVPIFAGPPIAGFIADEFNSYVPAFYIVGSIVVFTSALPFCLTLFERSKSESKNEMETQLSLVGARLANTDSSSLNVNVA